MTLTGRTHLPSKAIFPTSHLQTRARVRQALPAEFLYLVGWTGPLHRTQCLPRTAPAAQFSPLHRTSRSQLLTSVASRSATGVSWMLALAVRQPTDSSKNHKSSNQRERHLRPIPLRQPHRILSRCSSLRRNARSLLTPPRRCISRLTTCGRSWQTNHCQTQRTTAPRGHLLDAPSGIEGSRATPQARCTRHPQAI